MASRKTSNPRGKKKAGGAKGSTRRSSRQASPDSTTEQRSAEQPPTAPPPPRSPAEVREATKRLASLSRRASRVAADSALGASRRAVEAAPAVVIKAVSILEEEVAMGLGAMKRIEQRFLDVDALRKDDPDAVMSRFRRDAHDAVDIILDVLTAAAQTVGQQAGRFVNVTAGAAPATRDGAGGASPGAAVPALRIPGRVAAGASGSVTLALENPSTTGTADFALQASDLVSASGGRIPATSVHFDPAHLDVGPGKAGRVEVTVAVPDGTPAGIYDGILRATTLEGLRALLSVVVA